MQAVEYRPRAVLAHADDEREAEGGAVGGVEPAQRVDVGGGQGEEAAAALLVVRLPGEAAVDGQPAR